MFLFRSCTTTRLNRKSDSMREEKPHKPHDVTVPLYPKILSKEAIRLLQVLPDLDSTKPVRCKLTEYELPHHEAYEALSYCWGDAQDLTHEVECNGQIVRITPNLHNALVRLRKPDTARTMWIDAICINQADDQEKSAQVPLMAQIFSQATGVIAWLGNVEPEVARAASRGLEIIADEMFGPHLSDISEHYRALKAGTRKWKRLSDELESQMPWPELCELFSNPWFERIWVVQEVKLAQNVIVTWGQVMLDWQRLGATVLYLYTCVGAYKKEKLPSLSKHHSLFLVAGPRAYDFQESLQKFRQYKCSDPRDKVYGLLGLLDHPDFRMRTNVQITPDYSKSVTGVYTELAVALLMAQKDLRILRYVSHGRNINSEHRGPSWVPRWDIGSLHFRLPAGGCRASGRAKLDFINPLSKDTSRLELRGIFYDTIHDLSCRSDNSRSLRGVIDFCFESKSHSELRDTDNFFSCIARTLTATMVTAMPYQSYDDVTPAERQSFHQKFLEWIKEGSEVNIHDVNSIGYMVGKVCAKREIFKTVNGSYGLGPACMQAGDVVVVLLGGRTPYVLRPQGETFQFIGEAYIDELMNGRLVRDMKVGKVARRDFCIV